MRSIEVECFSRVSGYYRPVKQYNKAKKEEFAERKYLNIDEFINAPKKIVDFELSIL